VPGSDCVFEAQDVHYAYDGRASALAGVSLTIRRGERVAILGANGSGKSTLLKMLDGLYFPSRGSIRAFGQPLTERALQGEDFNFAFRRRVGLVFQDSDVQLFSPSVWDEVAFAPLQMGLCHAEVAERVEKALLALRIEKLRDRPPHRLSGGEKKRVALASILSLDPEVWLLDEPTAGLDPRSQVWLVSFLAAQGRAGKTIVTATHDLDIVQAISDRVYILDEEHRLIAEGATAEALGDHALLVACNLLNEAGHVHVGRSSSGGVHSTDAADAHTCLESGAALSALHRQ
jgi:cobalt/nickel transport system ATP-binding protein